MESFTTLLKYTLGLTSTVIIIVLFAAIATLLNDNSAMDLVSQIEDTNLSTTTNRDEISVASYAAQPVEANSQTQQHYKVNDSIIESKPILDNVASSQTIVATPTVYAPSSPRVTVDQVTVNVNKGDIAINFGRVDDFDSTTMQLQPSVGLVELMPDGSWLWTYLTDPNTFDAQTISIDVNQNGQLLDRASFTLFAQAVAESSAVLISASIVTDQSSVSVASGDTAVNTGTFEGLSSDDISSISVSEGSIELMPDGSWVWYSPADSFGNQDTPIYVDALTIYGETLNVTFNINIVNEVVQQNDDGVTVVETDEPTPISTDEPVVIIATNEPTQVPTTIIIEQPTEEPVVVISTNEPTQVPTTVPTEQPTEESVIVLATNEPTLVPTLVPTNEPTLVPTDIPTLVPTTVPTDIPTLVPTDIPTSEPTTVPTMVPTSTPISVPTDGVYYVSRNGNNQDGASWATAWNELDQINWAVVQPGDVIYIDGGPNQMRYETGIHIGRSGLPGQPIYIHASTEAGRSGQIEFFGGRHALLPYCGQQSYDNSIESSLEIWGIRSYDHSYIEIDGMTWSGIKIHGYRDNGIRIDRHSKNVTVRNVEIYNNGSARVESKWGGWGSDQPGIKWGGENMTFQRVIIHDNGQDAFQSIWGLDNNISNFLLEESWIYNERRHPTVDESANYCTHTDGIQIYDGGVVSGITVRSTVMGPGFTHNLILGQTMTSRGSWAHVNDVTLEDVLLFKAADNNINGYNGTEMHNWNFNRITMHCPKTKGHCVRVYDSDHSITNSVFVGSLLTFPDGINHVDNNCVWEARDNSDIGPDVDPQFLSVSNTDHFSLDNYTVQNPACAGSRVTSVQHLLSGAFHNAPIPVASQVQSSPVETQTEVIEIVEEVEEVQAVEPVETIIEPITITPVEPAITISEGMSAINALSISPQEAQIDAITASLGTVNQTPEGGWEWVYMSNDGPEVQMVTLDVMQNNEVVAQATFALTVMNVAPTGELSVTLTDASLMTVTASFDVVADVSSVDSLAGFSFQYDCDNDGIFEITTDTASYDCQVASLELVSLTARILDKDGDFTDYSVENLNLVPVEIVEVEPTPEAVIIVEEPTVEPTVEVTEQVVEETPLPATPEPTQEVVIEETPIVEEPTVEPTVEVTEQVVEETPLPATPEPTQEVVIEETPVVEEPTVEVTEQPTEEPLAEATEATPEEVVENTSNG